MAVYTPIQADQLQNFLSDYDLGTLADFEGIAQGVENTNYRVRTTQGLFILTLFEQRVSADDLPFFFAFTDHLFSRGIACPHAIRRRDREWLGNIAGRPAALISFMQGRDVNLNAITPDHCAALGAMVSRMHNAVPDFTGFRRNTLSLDEWTFMIEEFGPAVDESYPGLLTVLYNEIDFLSRSWPELRSMPRAVIHADIFPDNVFFGDDPRDGVAAVIDFYFSCLDFLAYDLALAINAWCFLPGGVFLSDRYRAFIQSYEAERGMTDTERAALSVLCRGAALRILLTRLHAVIHHPPGALVTPKDPVEYMAILEWHQKNDIGKS